MDEAAARGVRVVIADGHPVVREGLRAMLGTADLQVVGEAGTGGQVVGLVERLRPDVVVMDVRLPELDGLSAMAALKRLPFTTAVIVLTASTNLQHLIRSVVCGAAGYYLKGVSREELVAGIRAVAGGQSLLKVRDLHGVVELLLQEDARTAPFAVTRMGTLTTREREILGLMVQGLTNRQIGEILSVSAATVRAHVEHIIAKLGVSNRTQAAVWAVRAGLTSGL